MLARAQTRWENGETIPPIRGLDLENNRLDDYQRYVYKSVFHDLREVFAEDDMSLGKVDHHQHKIEVNTEKPISHKPRRQPLEMKEAVEKEVRRMLDLEVIEPSHSPWSFPVVMVKKPDGTWRFCVD